MRREVQVAVALLEDGAQVDDGVDVLRRRGCTVAPATRATRSRNSHSARSAAGSRGSLAPAKAYRRQRPSALPAWPSCTGLASARRTTGAEWKRVPITKPRGQRAGACAPPQITDGR